MSKLVSVHHMTEQSHRWLCIR